MLEEGVGEVTFLHKSIAEYHAAAFIKSCDDEFQKNFYSSAKENYFQWKECLIFLEAIDPLRFSKFYAIDIIKESVAILENLNKTKNSSELFNNLPIKINCNFTYTHLDGFSENEVQASLSITYHSEKNIYFSDFGHHIAKSILKNMPSTLNKSTASEYCIRNIFYLLDEDQKTYRMNQNQAIDFFSLENIKDEIAIYLQKLKKIEIEKNEDLNKIENRKLIFKNSNLISSPK